jgi:hypothetical protein
MARPATNFLDQDRGFMGAVRLNRLCRPYRARFTNYSCSIHRALMYARDCAGKLGSIANLIGENGEKAKQPLPGFLVEIAA